MLRFAALRGLIRRTVAQSLRLFRIAETMPLKLRLKRSSQFDFTSHWGEPFVEDWRRHLQSLRGRPDVQMLEIGSFEGRSAVWFLDNILTHESSRLTCIDPFNTLQRELRFDHNVRLSGHQSRLSKIKARSADVFPGMGDRVFDAIYIDGDHRATSVFFDLGCCWRLLKGSGVMIIDDYLWKPDLPPQDRPQLAIDLFLELLGDRGEMLHHDYQVILRKRENQQDSRTETAAHSATLDRKISG